MDKGNFKISTIIHYPKNLRRDTPLFKGRRYGKGQPGDKGAVLPDTRGQKHAGAAHRPGTHHFGAFPGTGHQPGGHCLCRDSHRAGRESPAGERGGRLHAGTGAGGLCRGGEAGGACSPARRHREAARAGAAGRGSALLPRHDPAKLCPGHAGVPGADIPPRAAGSGAAAGVSEGILMRIYRGKEKCLVKFKLDRESRRVYIIPIEMRRA